MPLSSRVAAQTVSVDVVQDTGRLLGLRDEWDDLLRDSASDCLFLTWEWLSTWWRHLSRDRRLFVLAARQRDRLVAVAPLAVRPPALSAVLPFATLGFMGTGSVGSDYLDVIVRRGCEAPALAALADLLAGTHRAIELEQVRHGTSCAAELASLLGRKGWSVSAEETNLSRYICLAGKSWDSFLASLGREHRADFQRKLRKLRRDFEVSLDTLTAEDQRPAALQRLFALHHARWRERGSSNAFHTPCHLRFHEDFSRMALARGWLRIHTLWLDGEPVAALYGFRYGRGFSFYQSGFDPAYARYSTGLVTMGLSIREAVEEGAEEYDMLQGLEAYKARWAREARPIGRLDLYPPHLRGRVYRRTMELSRAARRAARTVLPKGIADRIAAGRGPAPGGL